MGISLSSCPDEIWADALINFPYNMSFIQVVMTLNRRFRAIGVEVMRIRILRAVERFIPSSHHRTFFQMLHSRRSVIGGSVAQSVLTPAYFQEVLS